MPGSLLEGLDPFTIAALAVAGWVLSPILVSYVNKVVRPRSVQEEGTAEQATKFSVTLMARIDQLEQKMTRQEKSTDEARRRVGEAEARAEQAERRAEDAEKAHEHCEARVAELQARIEKIEQNGNH